MKGKKIFYLYKQNKRCANKFDADAKILNLKNLYQLIFVNANLKLISSNFYHFKLVAITFEMFLKLMHGLRNQHKDQLRDQMGCLYWVLCILNQYCQNEIS